MGGSALAGGNITGASNTLHSSVRTAAGAGKSTSALKGGSTANSVAGKATLKSIQKATDKKAGPLYHNKVVSEFIAS